MAKYKDLVGQKFGRWLVLSLNSFIERKDYKEAVWNCKCECGTERIVRSRLLLHKTSNSRSCGCIRSEQLAIDNHQLKHGLAHKHPLYPVWKTMRQRCSNPNSPKYYLYGGRGVKVCERWNDFKLFLEDMEPGYVSGLSIDRIDVNGNYEPSNCRWATAKEQANNTRQNAQIEYKNQVYTLAEASEKFGINAETIAYRIKAGWSVEDALTKASRIKNK